MAIQDFERCAAEARLALLDVTPADARCNGTCANRHSHPHATWLRCLHTVLPARPEHHDHGVRACHHHFRSVIGV